MSITSFTFPILITFKCLQKFRIVSITSTVSSTGIIEMSSSSSVNPLVFRNDSSTTVLRLLDLKRLIFVHFSKSRAPSSSSLPNHSIARRYPAYSRISEGAVPYFVIAGSYLQNTSSSTFRQYLNTCQDNCSTRSFSSATFITSSIRNILHTYGPHAVNIFLTKSISVASPSNNSGSVFSFLPLESMPTSGSPIR